MKNKKNLYGIAAWVLAALVLAGFASCGKKDSGSAASGGSSGGGSSGGVVEAASSAKSSSGGNANPATDFKYDLNKAGDGVVILAYIGKNGGKVVIPATIEDIPVVAIAGENPHDSEAPGKFTFSETSDEWIKKNPGKDFNSYGRKTRITSVVIPDTVTSIGRGAFYYCEALKEITLPKSLKAVGMGAFAGTGLTSLVIPEGVTEIGSEAFYGCKNLTSVTMPESLVAVGNGAFSSCSELTTVKLPSHALKYGKWDPFTYKFKEGLESWEPVFGDCPKLSLAARKAITASGYTGEF